MHYLKYTNFIHFYFISFYFLNFKNNFMLIWYFINVDNKNYLKIQQLDI